MATRKYEPIPYDQQKVDTWFSLWDSKYSPRWEVDSFGRYYLKPNTANDAQGTQTLEHAS